MSAKYYFGFSWSPSVGATTSFQLGPYDDKSEGEAAYAKTLKDLRYEPPKFWQYWRWGEGKPSDEVLRKMKNEHP